MKIETVGVVIQLLDILSNIQGLDLLPQKVEKLLNVTAVDRDAILKHYNVSPKELQDIIKSIQAWYEKQPHLPKGQLEYDMILQHLILKRFRIEEVKDKIDNIMSAKHKMPEILLTRDPSAPEIIKNLKFGFLVVLPKKTPSNYRVSIIRIKKPIDIVATDVVKTIFMMLDYRMRNDVSLGEQWIFDLTNVSFQNSVQMTPALLTKIIYYIRFCFGSKIKSIHFVNTPAFVVPVLNVVKKLMKPKVAKRICIHKNFDELQDLFPKSILPQEYGGDELSCEELTEDWTNVLQSDGWKYYFKEQDQVISDESKRTRFLSSDDFFGCEGSFRKLEVD